MIRLSAVGAVKDFEEREEKTPRGILVVTTPESETKHCHIRATQEKLSQVVLMCHILQYE